jgi:Mn2+/Fe2+ NRAMP family transporter
LNTQRAADAAATISIPSWLISIAADALPLVQVVAGLLAIVASVFAIFVHRRKLREKQQ